MTSAETETVTGAASDMHLLLLGGGHAHLEVLRSFARDPLPDVRLSLISKSAHAVYSGMLPGFVAGHYSAQDICIELAPLCRAAKCALHVAEITGFDAKRRSVTLSNGRSLAANGISINVGAVTQRASAAACGPALNAKPIDDFLQGWPCLLDELMEDDGLRVVVVGAGAAGVELALSIQHRLLHLASVDACESRVLLIDEGGILPGFSARVRQRLAVLLGRNGITTVGRFNGETGGHRYALVRATGVRAARWLMHSGLALDAAGFVAVDANLQSTSHVGIFCAGDAAGSITGTLPKAGVIAVRQGPVLAENLRRYATGRVLRPFVPPRRWLSLISAGSRYAVASRGGWSMEGRLVWLWKDWIDRRFVRRFSVSLWDRATRVISIEEMPK